MELNAKNEKLGEILSDMGRVLIAFSGGVAWHRDSFMELKLIVRRLIR